jgi:hypothetical protein
MIDLSEPGLPVFRFSGNRATTPRAGKTPRGGPTWARIGHDQALRANLTARGGARHRLMAAALERAATTVSAAYVTGGQEQGTLARTRCLEDQANECGIVRDVGIICLLTRCRSGLTGMVAMRGSYRRGGARSWPSLRPVPPDFLPRARSSPSSRVHVPGTFTIRGCPPVTDGLDGELARLQDRGTGGMALLQRCTRAQGLRRCVRLGGHLGSDTSGAAAVVPYGLEAGRPVTARTFSMQTRRGAVNDGR